MPISLEHAKKLFDKVLDENAEMASYTNEPHYFSEQAIQFLITIPLICLANVENTPW